MVIPDMLKNAPMFKRLEARIKVHNYILLRDIILFVLSCIVYLFADIFISTLKGKGSALGVGRGRAVAMRARVSCSSRSAH